MALFSSFLDPLRKYASPFTSLFKKPATPTLPGQNRSPYTASLFDPSATFSNPPTASPFTGQGGQASPFGFTAPQTPPAIPGVNFTPYRAIPNITSAVTKKPGIATPSGAIIDPATGQVITPAPAGQIPEWLRIMRGEPNLTSTTTPPPTTTTPGSPTSPNLPQGGPVAPQAPALPETPPEPTPTPPPQQPQAPAPLNVEQKAVADAQSLYNEALKLSPEELSTQEDIDKLVEATKKAYRNASNQPIALEFITGQLKSLEGRALDLAEPLERKLARMQAARTASLESSKFGLERADKALETARGGQKDIRTEAESARRFGIEQAGADQTRSLAEKTFNENVRQYGLDYAIKLRETAVKEMEAKQKAGETTGISTGAGSALQLVNDLLPRVSSIAGVFRTGRLTGDKAKFDQLTSTLSLNARQLIKGSGQISDFETKMLRDSASALVGGRLSEQFIDQELKKVRGVLNANAGLPVDVQIVKDGKVVDEGQLTRDDIFDAASQGYQIIYK